MKTKPIIFWNNAETWYHLNEDGTKYISEKDSDCYFSVEKVNKLNTINPNHFFIGDSKEEIIQQIAEKAFIRRYGDGTSGNVVCSGCKRKIQLHIDPEDFMVSTDDGYDRVIKIHDKKIYCLCGTGTRLFLDINVKTETF